MAIHRAADPTLYGMKAMVLKLGGFTKFELDHKMNAKQFYNFIMKMAAVISDEGISYN